MSVEKIITARKRAGLTQEQLATAIGVKRAVISKYETGAIEPSISQLQKIAAVLNIPLSSLLDLPEYDGLLREEHVKRITEALEETQGSLEGKIGTQKIGQRAEHLHQQDSNSKRTILSQEEVNRQIAEAEQEHTACLEKLCFDPTMPDEDYPARIRYITSFVEKNADTLRLAMPGTSMAPDDIEEAKKIRAAGGTPDSSK